MLQYAICEINKKQYRIIPGKQVLIDFQDTGKTEIEVSVLLLADDGKIKIGAPYLKEKIILKVMDNLKGEKIRVAKFHAKANYRKTTGLRPKYTQVIWKV